MSTDPKRRLTRHQRAFAHDDLDLGRDQTVSDRPARPRRGRVPAGCCRGAEPRPEGWVSLPARPRSVCGSGEVGRGATCPTASFRLRGCAHSELVQLPELVVGPLPRGHGADCVATRLMGVAQAPVLLLGEVVRASAIGKAVFRDERPLATTNATASSSSARGAWRRASGCELGQLGWRVILDADPPSLEAQPAHPLLEADVPESRYSLWRRDMAPRLFGRGGCACRRRDA